MTNTPALPMAGKLCMVTGSTSGIGAATALLLAEQGADVIIVGRNEEKCVEQARGISQRCPWSKVDYLVADLSLQSDIRALAARFKSRYNRLDVLINNAGAKILDRIITPEGQEMTFALNHLAYFLLTLLLLDELKASPQGRIINVSSGSHSGCASIDFDDLKGEKRYIGKEAYAQSKLANLLFTYELARRLEGTKVTVNALEPGGVISGFCRNNGWISWTKHVFAHILQRNLTGPEKGAFASVYLASSPEVSSISGRYFSKDRAVRSSDASYDQNMARRLWQVSAEMTVIRENAEMPGMSS